ncbi:MAG: Uma2 family endonuclease [Solirubrobacteraceae bacterium]
MRTLVCDPPPAGIEAFLERRKRLGQDRRDEVWEGVLHVVPGPSGEHSELGAQVTSLLRPVATAEGLTVSLEFNLGDSIDDYRVPDAGLHRSRPKGTWLPTAALAIEIVSRGDETWEKLPFYAAHDVEELLILDPEQRAVHWLALSGGAYEPVERSRLIDLSAAELAQRIDWP